MRASGVLLGISSLPSEYGIGCFSKSAYHFVDALHRAGQKYWQILPMGPTGYGDSPYQSFSTFAGNPYFIDLKTLIEEGLLTKEECDQADFGKNEHYVNYSKIFESRFALLHKAFERSNIHVSIEYNEYVESQAYWLSWYSLYMAVKDKFNGASFTQWDEDIRLLKPSAVAKYSVELSHEVDFYKFLQYKFDQQWKKLKQYANSKGIQIIGDIPIYVAYDSADTWGEPDLFQLDEHKRPIAVAGCPPDYFSATGQLWGNPLYNWEYHKKTSFNWWKLRLKHCFDLYDVVRVDHFRGFDEYYAIPFGKENAIEGKWEKGPGLEFFTEIKKELGDVHIIAEDLGLLTDSVVKLVEDAGFPGMKVLQFAFDSDSDNAYLPHNHKNNSVVYTGTHDNDTLCGWYETLSDTTREFVNEYLGLPIDHKGNVNWELIRCAYASVADLVIVPLQDYLMVGKEGRMNTPSTLGFNWEWRMSKGQFVLALQDKINRLTKIYNR